MLLYHMLVFILNTQNLSTCMALIHLPTLFLLFLLHFLHILHILHILRLCGQIIYPHHQQHLHPIPLLQTHFKSNKIFNTSSCRSKREIQTTTHFHGLQLKFLIMLCSTKSLLSLSQIHFLRWKMMTWTFPMMKAVVPQLIINLLTKTTALKKH